jgi:hypothetical protein
MDSQPVSAEYLKAGEDYLAALRRLGLRPMFLGWGREISSKQWLLVMVTSIIDAGGPLALNQLLFKAYNAEATPKEISPFIVRVYSPEVAPDTLYALGGKSMKIVNNPELAEKISVSNMMFTFHDVDYEMINAYAIPHHAKATKPKYHAALAEWQRFKRNVDKLAA